MIATIWSDWRVTLVFMSVSVLLLALPDAVSLE